MSRMPDPHDVFFQYPVTPFATSAGNVDLPIFYYDNSLCMAVFLVDLDKARALVTDERLQVVPAWGGKALVGLAFYEYRHTAIGAYNEVGLAVLTAPRGCRLPRLPLLRMLGSLDRNPMGFHILDLPVTTEVACAAGREAWGLPKFVTPIDFALRGREFRGSVRDPEGITRSSRWKARAGSACRGHCWTCRSIRCGTASCCAPWSTPGAARPACSAAACG